MRGHIGRSAREGVAGLAAQKLPDVDERYSPFGEFHHRLLIMHIFVTLTEDFIYLSIQDSYFYNQWLLNLQESPI